MTDEKGNKFSKFGEISREYLVEGRSVEIGSKVVFFAQIKGHTEFNGEKITQLGRLT